MVKVVKLQAEFPAIGKSIGVKFKTVELASKSRFTRCGEKSSRTDCGIKKNFGPNT